MAPATNDFGVNVRVLYASDFYTLGVARTEQAALLRRTPQVFPANAVLREENERVIAWFKRCLVEGLVVDMREAPPNNDEQFEAGMHRLRSAVGKTFRRVVVVVASAAGEMQVTRLHRDERAAYRVTRDYALAWLLAANAGA